MNIGMQTDDVKGKAESLRGTGTELFHEMKAFLDSVVNQELPELWQGSGAESYISRYQQLAPSFQAIEQLINDIADGLIANANFYEEADATAAAANARS